MCTAQVVPETTVGVDLGDRQSAVCRLNQAAQVVERAAHYILGPFGPHTDLRRWGLAIAASSGGRKAKKRAVVAVARKLAVLLHRLWVTGERYEPLRNAQQRLTAA